MLRLWSRLSCLVSSRFSAGRLVLATLAALFACLLPMALGLFSAPATAVQNPATAKLVPVKADASKKPEIPAPVVAPPGCDLYIAQRGDSLPAVARKYLRRTKYLTSSELTEAIHQANPNRRSVFLKSGEALVIPGMLDAPIVERTVPVARDFEVRAIYLTGVMAGSDHGLRIIRHWREVGGNAVVFDIKDSDGIVNVAFDHPLAAGQRHYISDLPKFIHFLHSENMHAIARIAIFRDEHLVTSHPELAVQSRSTGQPWRENGKLVWTDPSNPKVQDYDISLAKFVAQAGVDEVQFDYVRFPAEGDQKDALFKFQAEHPAAPANDHPADVAKTDPSKTDVAKTDPTKTDPAKTDLAKTDTAKTDHPKNDHPKNDHAKKDDPKTVQRSDVIAGFLDRAYAEIHPTGALFSLDVFGIMAWQRPVDLAHTGQDIVAMAKHCDVLSPMIYPSHFFGMDGIPHPGDAPEHFIAESMDRFELITKDSGVVIRPWLQAFAWRTRTYSPQYVETQVEVAKQKGGIGFLFWNANNDYSKPYTAMPEMQAADSKNKDRYFRGDEVGSKPEPAAPTPVASTSVETGLAASAIASAPSAQENRQH
ncbi:MAG: putative glycoside hydrolase [Terriglobales bacterium]